MNTRLHEAHFGVPKYSETEKLAIQSLYESRRPASTPGSKQERGSWKGREGERKTKKTPAIQAAHTESYKRQNAKLNDSAPARDCQELWGIIKNALKLEMSQPSYETWIEPVAPVGYEFNNLVIAATSGFNKGQIVKRFLPRLKELVSELTDNALSLEIVVDESLQTQSHQQTPIIKAVPNNRRGKTAYGMRQNPTNNPVIDKLLEEYGDMRSLFMEREAFQKVWRARDKGGWGMNFGKLMKAGTQYGLERVLWARKVMQKHEDLADNPGGLFLHYVKTGKVS